MDNFFIALWSAGGSISLLGTLYIIVQLIVNPDKVEKWASIINKILADVGGIFKFAHRNYVKYDLQSRINIFTKEVASSAPYLEDTKIAIEWTDTTIDREAFMQNGKAIIRLRRDDPEDLNFVHGAYWSVSTQLLPKVKRYISDTQKKAVDLYVTAKVIEQEKYHVIDHFLEHYLHPNIEKSDKLREIFDNFRTIDRYGAFYPVFLQELYFLSMKVYGSPKNSQIIVEVTRLADFLHRFATRTVGDDSDSHFLGEYCKFGIVIVGTGATMSLRGTDPYVNYIKKALLPKDVETIYILGKYEHYDFINEVCDILDKSYSPFKSHKYEAELTFSDGQTSKESTHLVVLRSRHAEIY